jgi:hypothetical protein
MTLRQKFVVWDLCYDFRTSFSPRPAYAKRAYGAGLEVPAWDVPNVPEAFFVRFS